MAYIVVVHFRTDVGSRWIEKDRFYYYDIGFDAERAYQEKCIEAEKYKYVAVRLYKRKFWLFGPYVKKKEFFIGERAK